MPGLHRDAGFSVRLFLVMIDPPQNEIATTASIQEMGLFLDAVSHSLDPRLGGRIEHMHVLRRDAQADGVSRTHLGAPGDYHRQLRLSSR